MGRRGKSAARERPTPRIVEDVDESEDEEIPEDEAFNSEDERLYGHFFDNSGDETEDGSDSEDDESEDDDDDDGGQYMLDLLNQLDDKKESEPGTSMAQMAKLPESEFSVSKKGITLDHLMEGISNTQGFKDLQKSLASKPSTTQAPLDKKLSNRVERKIAYEARSRDISRWVQAIQENRTAESLDFKPKEKTNLTRDMLVEKFEAKTDFEKELEEALEEAGQQDENAILQKEEEALQDDLGSNRLTMEEYKKRRGQLAQIRALMFYHERKRHQMKKIKSKKYRKIRKKQRERLKESAIEAAMEEDEDLAKELKEKEEVARIQERMTLAHKNTSKWAKRILKRGKNVDVDTRRALSAQLKRGDDLRKKMMGSDDEKSQSDDDDDENLIESARKVLEETEDDSDPTHGKTGLFKLSFMQKGIQKQRDQAREEARKLLGELEANEEDDYDTMVEEEKVAESTPIAKDMTGVLEQGELVASSLAFGNSNAIATSNGIEIDLEIGEEKATDSAQPTTTSSEYVAVMNLKGGDNLPAPSSKKSKQPAPEKRVVVSDGDEANPWMKSTEGSTKSSKRRKGIVNIEGATSILDAHEEPNQPSGDDSNKAITSLTQEELVRRAFVSQNESEIDEDFRKEKEAMTNDPTRKVEKAPTDDVLGWGSWTGQGAPPPKPRKLPKKLQAPKQRKEKTKRKEASRPDVILNKKRLKKTANQFMLADVPQPYSSRAEYEHAMLGGVGKEWNVSASFKSQTRPEILTRSGKIIQPISKKAKQPRPAAKF